MSSLEEAIFEALAGISGDRYGDWRREAAVAVVGWIREWLSSPHDEAIEAAARAVASLNDNAWSELSDVHRDDWRNDVFVAVEAFVSALLQEMK